MGGQPARRADADPVLRPACGDLDRARPISRGPGTPLEDYATNTADELRGFEDGFELKGSRPLGGPYEAVEVYGTGRSRDGVDQKVSVIALRRDRLATITAVLAANAKPAARESARVGRRVIATIRTRRPSTGHG